MNFNAAFTISKNDYLQLFLKYMDTFFYFSDPQCAISTCIIEAGIPKI